MSIMSTRSNALESANLNNTMEERSLISGFNTSKNIYLKNSLNKTHKNNSAAGGAMMSSMMSGDSVHDDSPQRKNESEMI